MKIFSIAIILLLFAVFGTLSSFAQGTAFNYQGQLDSSNSPAKGNYDMQFALYATSTGNSLIVGPVTNTAVAVTNGAFTTTINFGATAFTGATNWLDIAVRTNFPAPFTELTPRQQILPVPYAIYAASASNAISATTAATATTATTAVTAENIAAGAINGSSIAAGTLTAADFAPGQFVTNFNGLSGAVTLAVSNNLFLTTNANTVTIGSGGDFLYYYFDVSSTAYTVNAFYPVPVTSAFFNGWQYLSSYGTSQPVFVVPATGYYNIAIEGTTSASSPSPLIGAEYGAHISSTALLAGSDAYISGATFSHTFIAQLTAGYVIYFGNVGSSSIQFGPVSGGGMVFSVTITRIN